MSDAMTTDLYEVTMAMSHLKEGLTGPATFSLFVRDMPPDRGFPVAAGLESSLDFLSGHRITSEDVDAFASVLRRPPRDLHPLLGMGFTGQVRTVPEGRLVLAGEPLTLPHGEITEKERNGVVRRRPAAPGSHGLRAIAGPGSTSPMISSRMPAARRRKILSRSPRLHSGCAHGGS
ncbi:hypothetical protein PV333_18590 [Streptomyces sp. NY05-11A]|nr:hypothetical protein [Streptomyces sp. NY05-11A]MDX2678352.1 hypothetical protein [Streptomyces sp. NY05-11A]